MKAAPRSPLTRFLNWLGSHELAVLLGVAGVAAGVWIFALIAGEVMEGDTQAFDEKVLLAMRRADRTPIGPPSLQEAARDVTALGGVAVLGLLTAIAGGFLSLAGKRRLAMFLVASVTSGVVASTILKELIERARPDLVPHGSYVYTTSFPSGHSMMAAITYLTMGALLARSQPSRRLKAYVLQLAVVLTVMVGVSRVYLGVHWPTDVMAGWTAGAVWALLCWLGARWLQRRRSIEREAEVTSDSGPGVREQ